MQSDSSVTQPDNKVNSYAVVYVLSMVLMFVAFAANVYVISAVAGLFLFLLCIHLTSKSQSVLKDSGGWIVDVINGTLVIGVSAGGLVGALSLLKLFV